MRWNLSPSFHQICLHFSIVWQSRLEMHLTCCCPLNPVPQHPNNDAVVHSQSFKLQPVLRHWAWLPDMQQSLCSNTVHCVGDSVGVYVGEDVGCCVLSVKKVSFGSDILLWRGFCTNYFAHYLPLRLAISLGRLWAVVFHCNTERKLECAFNSYNVNVKEASSSTYRYCWRYRWIQCWRIARWKSPKKSIHYGQEVTVRLLK